MTFIQKLESLDQLIDYAPTLDKATSHEVYYPSGEASRFHVIKNNTTQEEVCTVSDRYSILQHSDALNLIVSGLQAAGITGAGTLRNYNNNVVVECYFDNLTVRDHSQDGHIQLGMRFTNSFNKTVGFNGMAFGWRQVCQNGLLMSRMVPNAPQMTLKHMGDVVERITNNVKSFVENIVKMEGSLLTIINEARNEIITFESHDQLIRYTSQFVGSEKRAKQIFEIEPVELSTSKWDLYNALTSVVSHDNSLSYNQYTTIHSGAQDMLLKPVVLPDMSREAMTVVPRIVA